MQMCTAISAENLLRHSKFPLECSNYFKFHRNVSWNVLIYDLILHLSNAWILIQSKIYFYDRELDDSI